MELGNIAPTNGGNAIFAFSIRIEVQRVVTSKFENRVPTNGGDAISAFSIATKSASGACLKLGNIAPTNGGDAIFAFSIRISVQRVVMIKFENRVPTNGGDAISAFSNATKSATLFHLHRFACNFFCYTKVKKTTPLCNSNFLKSHTYKVELLSNFVNFI